jgi:predicted RNA-binding protein with PUA-like domain
MLELTSQVFKKAYGVQHIKPGDYLLYCLTGLSRQVGIMEVISDTHRDNTRIWKEDVFPSRVRVKVVVKLTQETVVPLNELRAYPNMDWTRPMLERE